MRVRLGILIALGVGLVFAGCVQAHEGPPFPLVMQQPAGPYLISVWTDPDVGVGKFFVILEGSAGTQQPVENQVQVCVQPLSGRLPEACSEATHQHLRNRVQYYAEVDFDQQEMWRVRVRVTGPAGSGEVLTEVEATPPGFGRWDLLIYGFPFLLFGGLWLYVALRRRLAAPLPHASSTAPEMREKKA